MMDWEEVAFLLYGKAQLLIAALEKEDRYPVGPALDLEDACEVYEKLYKDSLND